MATDSLLLLLTSGLTAAAALSGVWLTQSLTDRRERAKELDARRNEIKRLRINELYGPLLSMLAEMQARKKAYIELSRTSAQLSAKYKDAGDPARATQFSEEVHYLHSHAAKRYREVDLPMLRQMLQILRQNGWLAEQSTLAYYPRLMMLSEIWEMRQDNRLDFETIAKVIHEDELFFEFQQELEHQRDALMRSLSAESAGALPVTPKGIDSGNLIAPAAGPK